MKYTRLVFLLVLLSLLLPLSSQIPAAGDSENEVAEAASAASLFGDFWKAQAAEVEPTELEQAIGWIVRPGDWIRMNVTTNKINIIRADYSEVSSAIQAGSGVQRMVSWIGRYYYGATPEDTWLINSVENKSLHWVFGTNEVDENGRRVREQPFFRMKLVDENGVAQHTPYGLHTTPNFDIIVEHSNGYGSYGCVLTNYQFTQFLKEMLQYQLDNGEDGIKIVTYS